MVGDLMIVSGNANVPLAKAICRKAGVVLGDCDISRFSNDNVKVNYNEKKIKCQEERPKDF